ncbi:MAG: flavodoxin family protein, partial [Candidatus Hodarchaeota archaeon]
MKILITYYSETGNTEKIAKGIGEGISSENPVIKPVKEVDINSIADYDLIFFGAPTQSNGLPKAAKNFLKTCPEDAACKFALFSTHGSIEKSFYTSFFKAANKILGKKNIMVVEQFDSVGELKNEQVIQMLRSAMPDIIDDMIKNAKGHPNATDL